MIRRRPPLLGRLAYQGVWLLALAGYLAGVLGVPVPATSDAKNAMVKDTSLPFPCASRQCGCRSAAQCWRGCCCFTNRQKLAWAAANGVSPPAFVVAAAKREPAPERCGSSCCSTTSAGATPSATVAQSNVSAPIALDFVVAIKARECRGQTDEWLYVGAVMPLVDACRLVPEQRCTGALAQTERKLSSIKLSPAAPPPRQSEA